MDRGRLVGGGGGIGRGSRHIDVVRFCGAKMRIRANLPSLLSKYIQVVEDEEGSCFSEKALLVLLLVVWTCSSVVI